ncbi:hypothetical protein H4219_001483 [Mycoemilia scoparia]|uniref:JmjC domain-containing protein n=1 Tax=Mycoemilia scoparia TaxID=417184 RepID=A0A9W8A070_9FUNG|nr:hypothetical protein H4219_001483 [Mycoemilia scoparia]
MDEILDQLEYDAQNIAPKEYLQNACLEFKQYLKQVTNAKAGKNKPASGVAVEPRRQRLTLPAPKHDESMDPSCALSPGSSGPEPPITTKPNADGIVSKTTSSMPSENLRKYDLLCESIYQGIVANMANNAGEKGVVFPLLVLYTDVSILKCIDFISKQSAQQEDRRDQAVGVLHSLDKALIIAGGGLEPQRRDHIHHLINILTNRYDLKQQDSRHGPIAKDVEIQGAVPSPAIKLELRHSLKCPCPSYDTPPSLEKFQSMIKDLSKSTPFVIKNAISFWPALQPQQQQSNSNSADGSSSTPGQRNWQNLEYLRKKVGPHRLVPIEIGSRYTDDTWRQEYMEFGDYIDKVLIPSLKSPSEKEAGDVYYLAQHNLLLQVPELQDDFVVPDYAMASTGRTRKGGQDEEDVVVHHWIGPKGTVTPLHFDNNDNLLAQVAGAKYVRLYDPKYSVNLYPYPPDSQLPNTSQVDIEYPDAQKYPLFNDTPYVEAIIESGDLLYMPVSYLKPQ